MCTNRMFFSTKESLLEFIQPFVQLFGGGKPTPLKTNMSPENRWLEDVFPTEMVTF